MVRYTMWVCDIIKIYYRLLTNADIMWIELNAWMHRSNIGGQKSK